MTRYFINVLCVLFIVEGLEYFNMLSVNQHSISLIIGFMYIHLCGDINKIIQTQQDTIGKFDEIIESQEGLKKESFEERRLAVKHIAKLIEYRHQIILKEIRNNCYKEENKRSIH